MPLKVVGAGLGRTGTHSLKLALEWHPGDGWGPLCAALGVEIPDEPFPHVNSTEEFRAMAGLDG